VNSAMWRGKTSHLSFALRKDSWIDFPSLRRSWSFRCRAKVRTLLEVKRTRRVHRERVDSALLIRSRHARIVV
jgi:hypothetical protein